MCRSISITTLRSGSRAGWYPDERNNGCVSFDLFVFPPDGPATIQECHAALEAEEARLEGPEQDEELPTMGPEMAAFVAELERRWPSLDADPDGSPWSSWPLWQPMVGGGTALNIKWSRADEMRAAVLEAADRSNVVIYDPQLDEVVPPRGKGPSRRRLFRRG